MKLSKLTEFIDYKSMPTTIRLNSERELGNDFDFEFIEEKK
jgi:hypothetical protein